MSKVKVRPSFDGAGVPTSPPGPPVPPIGIPEEFNGNMPLYITSFIEHNDYTTLFTDGVFGANSNNTLFISGEQLSSNNNTTLYTNGVGISNSNNTLYVSGGLSSANEKY